MVEVGVMDPLIERFLAREEKRKPKSYPTRRAHLRNFNEWLEREGETVATIDGLTLEGFLFELGAEDYSPTYVAGHFDTLQHMFSMLVDPLKELDESPMVGLIKSDYTTNQPRKQEIADIVYLTPEEVDLLCEHVPSPKLRNELILRTMFVLGLREGEVASIKVNDIDREERSLRVKNLKRGPNQRAYRTVYWHDSEFDTLLSLWLDSNREAFSTARESPYLFVSVQNPKIHPTRVNKVVNEAAKAAGIQETYYVDKNGQERRKWTSHALRHGHAVYALKSNVDVRSVQLQLGHSKLEMTMRYLQFVEKDVRDSYRRWGDDQQTNRAVQSPLRPPINLGPLPPIHSLGDGDRDPGRSVGPTPSRVARQHHRTLRTPSYAPLFPARDQSPSG